MKINPLTSDQYLDHIIKTLNSKFADHNWQELKVIARIIMLLAHERITNQQGVTK